MSIIGGDYHDWKTPSDPLTDCMNRILWKTSIPLSDEELSVLFGLRKPAMSYPSIPLSVRHIIECKLCGTAGRTSDFKGYVRLVDSCDGGVNKVICPKCVGKVRNEINGDLKTQMEELVKTVNANSVGVQNVYDKFVELEKTVTKAETEAQNSKLNDDELVNEIVKLIWTGKGRSYRVDEMALYNNLLRDVQDFVSENLWI